MFISLTLESRTPTTNPDHTHALDHSAMAPPRHQSVCFKIVSDFKLRSKGKILIIWVSVFNSTFSGSYKSAPIAATFWLVRRKIRRVAAAAAIVYCGGRNRTRRNRHLHLHLHFHFHLHLHLHPNRRIQMNKSIAACFPLRRVFYCGNIDITPQ